MIQRFKILKKFEDEDNEINSSLSKINNYQVNVLDGLGDGIVNYSNVRSFLNSNSNQIIIEDFFSFLSANTNSIQFNEIFYNDYKLSYVFNEYYNSAILLNNSPSLNIINSNITGTTEVLFHKNQTFQYNGVSPSKYLDNLPLSIENSDRINEESFLLDSKSREDSYYIPVFIKKKINLTEKQNVYLRKLDMIFKDLEIDATNQTVKKPDSNIVNILNPLIIPGFGQ